MFPDQQAQPRWRQSVLVEHFSDSPEPFDDAALAQEKVKVRMIPPYKALRSSSHCYVEYKTGEREFYDLQKDPNQLENLLSGSHPVDTTNYADVLHQLQNCAGATCRTAEDLLLP